jgi:hypothetical protein
MTTIKDTWGGRRERKGEGGERGGKGARRELTSVGQGGTRMEDARPDDDDKGHLDLDPKKQRGV